MLLSAINSIGSFFSAFPGFIGTQQLAVFFLAAPDAQRWSELDTLWQDTFSADVADEVTFCHVQGIQVGLIASSHSDEV